MRIVRAWARGWVYLLGAVGLAIVGAVELVLVTLTAGLMVVVIGQAVARVVLPLGRTLADQELRLAAWLRRRDERYALPPPPAAQGIAATGMAYLRDPVTWRLQGWILATLGLVLIDLTAMIAFPLAPLWAKLRAALAVVVLTRPRRARRAGTSSASSTSRSLPTGGHGVIGMHERTTALGGSFAARPTADGGFEVYARLPLPPLADAPPSRPSQAGPASSSAPPWPPQPSTDLNPNGELASVDLGPSGQLTSAGGPAAG